MAALVTIMASSALVASPASAASGVRITGTVSDASGYPLAGVVVEVVRADHEDILFRPSTAEITGRFDSPKIPYEAKTKYQVKVTDPTGRHQEFFSKAFTATAAHAKQNVTMADAAIIRGKITTNSGTKVRPAFVSVTAFRATKGGYTNSGYTTSSPPGRL